VTGDLSAEGINVTVTVAIPEVKMFNEHICLSDLGYEVVGMTISDSSGIDIPRSEFTRLLNFLRPLEVFFGDFIFNSEVVIKVTENNRLGMVEVLLKAILGHNNGNWMDLMVKDDVSLIEILISILIRNFNFPQGILINELVELITQQRNLELNSLAIQIGVNGMLLQVFFERHGRFLVGYLSDYKVILG
jgi:hypothetical protein